MPVLPASRMHRFSCAEALLVLLLLCIPGWSKPLRPPIEAGEHGGDANKDTPITPATLTSLYDSIRNDLKNDPRYALQDIYLKQGQTTFEFNDTVWQLIPSDCVDAACNKIESSESNGTTSRDTGKGSSSVKRSVENKQQSSRRASRIQKQQPTSEFGTGPPQGAKGPWEAWEKPYEGQ